MIVAPITAALPGLGVHELDTVVTGEPGSTSRVTAIGEAKSANAGVDMRQLRHLERLRGLLPLVIAKTLFFAKTFQRMRWEIYVRRKVFVIMTAALVRHSTRRGHVGHRQSGAANRHPRAPGTSVSRQPR
jgi:hypothetical protein